MTRRMRIIQVVSEALLPVLGFLLWNWSLYFILLYYLLDLLADVIITHIKSRKIIAFKKETPIKWMQYGIIGGLLFISTVFMIHVAVQSIFPSIQFDQEALAFWIYKDMGIEQGYVLLPLISFVSYQQYKTEFLRLRRYESISLTDLWHGKIMAFSIILASCGGVFLLSAFVRLDEYVYVFGIVALTSIYRFFVKD